MTDIDYDALCERLDKGTFVGHDLDDAATAIHELRKDAERIDFMERTGFDISCQWYKTDWCGGPRWLVRQKDNPHWYYAETLRQAIDAAIAGEKP